MFAGVFCIQMVRSRIGLLFLSEIIENGSLLDIPNKYQYDLVSVVNDLPKQQDTQTHFKIIESVNRLTRLGKE